MKVAVVYAAKSTEDKHGSIPTQLEDCRRRAEREGWQIVAEFSDDAQRQPWSGGSNGRRRSRPRPPPSPAAAS
jgi:hypothetical protein